MGKTEAQTIKHTNAMPAPTWHFLKANDTQIEIPDGLAVGPHVQVDAPADARGDDDAFDRALSRVGTIEPGTIVPSADGTMEPGTNVPMYGETALSAYQARAEALEAASTVEGFEHGTGAETAAFLHEAAGKRIVIVAAEGRTIDAQVIVAAVPGAISVAAIDIVAEQTSSVNLSIVVGSDIAEKDGGTAETAKSAGIAGTTIRVLADADAHVNIVRTQALDEAFGDIDDMALIAAENAHIDVRQTVLGGLRTYTGLAGDLQGASSQVDICTRYLGHGEQNHDFNYSLRHHGPKSKCDLQANGVLAGQSRKTLRGTIDLVRGCKGAEGTERETVLLVDDGVRNKTIPVILCNEDDVAGNHGATIGHIRDEQMFYLATRGFSREAADRMFVGAVLEQAAIDAPDQAARTAVLDLGEKLSPGFTELFDEL